MSRAMSLLSQTELAIRPISLAAADLVFLRHILEASEGLGFVVGNKGGDVLLVSTQAMERQLDEFISDLGRELPLVEGMTQAHQEVIDAHK